MEALRLGIVAEGREAVYMGFSEPAELYGKDASFDLIVVEESLFSSFSGEGGLFMLNIAHPLHPYSGLDL
jgi:hypothetical protein